MSTYNNAVSFHELSKASIRLLVEKEKVLFQSSAQGNKARRYRNELRRVKNDLENKKAYINELENQKKKFFIRSFRITRKVEMLR